MQLRSAISCALLILTAGRAAADDLAPARGRGWAQRVAAPRALAAAPLAGDPRPAVLGPIAWTAGGIPVCAEGSLQFSPRIAPDDNGGVIAAWVDFRRFHYDIYAMRLDGNGNRMWPDAGVVVSANDSLLFQPLAMPDGAEGAFVIFGQFTNAGLYSDVLVQHLTSTGAIAPGWPANGRSTAPEGAREFGAVPTGDGFLLMSWTDLSGQLRLVRLSGAGAIASGWTSAGLAVGRPQNEGTIGVAPDAAGGGYICWVEGDSLMLTRVAAAGGVAPGWTAAGTVVNEATTLTGKVSPALLTGGDVMVVWPDDRNLTDSDLYAMRYTSAGAPAPGWPATGALVLGGPVFHEQPEAISDGAGGAVVVCNAGLDSVVAQRVTGSGGIFAGWPPAGVALSRHENTTFHAPASDGLGGALIAWSAIKNVEEDIFAQRVTGAGAIASGWASGGKIVCAEAASQLDPVIVTDGNGGLIAVWQDNRGPYTAVYAGRVQSDGTVGTLAALVSASAEPGFARLHWFSAAGAAFEAGVERAAGAGAFAEIARVRADGLGHIRYEDRDVVAGETYRYRLAVRENGATSYLGEVALRVPEGLRLSLAGFVPNPVVGAPRLAYTLATGERARIEVLDTAGRRVAERELESTPGEHVVTFEGVALRPGVYRLRLTQGARSVTARAVIVR